MKIIPGEKKLTIQNFDKWVDGVILQRGKQYYNNGAVIEIEENHDSWTAEVEGSEIYAVTISLKNDLEISQCFCDCPYDGGICKHLVAVFFAVREEIKDRKPETRKALKKNQLDDLLSKITVDEYRGFIKHYAVKNKDFKTALEIFFADKDDRIDIAAKYTDLLRKLVKKYSSQGYVDYRSSSGLANEVGKMINNAYELSHKKNFMDAFAIAITVLREMIDVLSYSDDSNGSLSGTCFGTVELIGAIAGSEDAPIDMQEHIFNILRAELNNQQYFELGDIGYDMFALFESLAIELNKDEGFLGFIDGLLPKLTGRYDNYRRDFLKTSRIDFLKATGRNEEAEVLVQQNLDIESVRQGEVNKAIDKKDFVAAKKLIADGIKIAEAEQHSGTVLSWEKELLRIAILEKDITLVRYYYKRFAFDRLWLSKEYYNLLKETYTKEEWPDIIEAHINETIEKVEDDKSRWGTLNSKLLDALSAIYIEEKYWDRLFALVKNETGLEKIMQYHSYLIADYSAELLKLYLPGLAIQGDKASDRSQYANLVGTMRKIIKDIPLGKEPIIAIAKNLKEKYPRRPAMVDELNKLFL